MAAFAVVWFGQLVSLTGTAMAQFALTIWAWQVSGQATALALVGFFNFAPTVIFSPIAGALVDRWNRKLVMMLSDMASGLVTIAVLILYALGRLEIGHLYVGGAITGTFQSFQFPAYSAAISVMIPKEHYARANGMLELAYSASGIGAPILAGALLPVIDLSGIFAIDIVALLIALGALLIVHVPQPPVSEEGRAGQGSLLRESIYGFEYIWQRPSLLGLQLVFLAGNLIGSVGWVLLAPMVLARTGDNSLALGTVESVLGIGGVVGGLVMSAWGGPRRRVHGVLLGHALIGLLGTTVIGLGRGVPVWAAGAFLMMFFIPIINGSNQAIWQSKVPPDVQGRVFSVRRLIAQISAPLAMVVAGPLADFVFEPAMMPGGTLATSFGWLVGTGRGAGMSLLFVVTGLMSLAVGLVPYLIPPIWNVETLLPDHAAAPEGAQSTTG